jgi:Flp pilus assembly protein TadB
MIDPAVKKTIWWLASLVAAIVIATLAIDARYAKAADVKRAEEAVAAAKKELKKELAAQRAYTDAGFLRQRKNSLEDKVFELEAKRDARMINQWELKQFFRYKAELDDVNRELRVKVQQP